MIKRFIAGAVCPKCASMDTIMASEDKDLKVMIRQCVECGFSDRLSTVVNQPREVITRVNSTSDSSFEAVQVIKILK